MAWIAAASSGPASLISILMAASDWALTQVGGKLLGALHAFRITIRQEALAITQQGELHQFFHDVHHAIVVSRRFRTPASSNSRYALGTEVWLGMVSFSLDDGPKLEWKQAAPFLLGHADYPRGRSMRGVSAANLKVV